MMKHFGLIVLMIHLLPETGLCALNGVQQRNINSNSALKDTIKERQVLYNGKVWTNKFRYVDGDQFLFSELSMPGSISINKKTFNNLWVKYDIFSDEIITPLNDEYVLQLNKEMVDSFSLTFENRTYRFIKIPNDSPEGVSGYVQLLFNGHSRFFVKYKKSISYFDAKKANGQFSQDFTMFLDKGDIVYQINNKNDLYDVFQEKKKQIREYIKKNKLKVTKKSPESFVPVIRFYDNIIQ